MPTYLYQAGLRYRIARSPTETVTYIRRPGNHLDVQIAQGKFRTEPTQEEPSAAAASSTGGQADGLMPSAGAPPRGAAEEAAEAAVRQKLAYVRAKTQALLEWARERRIVPPL